MDVIARTKALFITAALVILIPVFYWTWTFYRTADALSELSAVNETVLQKIDIAFGLFRVDFQAAPLVYLVPLVIAAGLVAISIRRRR